MTDEEQPDTALPFPDAASAVVAEPEQVADEFIAAAREAAEESGVKIGAGRKRRAKSDDTTPATTVALAPVIRWEPDGIGKAATFAFDLVLARADMPTLEPEEEKKVADVTAMYLNLRVPRGAAVQPEIMIVAMLASIMGPRIAAKKMAAQLEAQNTVTSLHDNVPEGRG